MRYLLRRQQTTEPIKPIQTQPHPNRPSLPVMVWGFLEHWKLTRPTGPGINNWALPKRRPKLHSWFVQRCLTFSMPLSSFAICVLLWLQLSAYMYTFCNLETVCCSCGVTDVGQKHKADFWIIISLLQTGLENTQNFRLSLFKIYIFLIFPSSCTNF